MNTKIGTSFGLALLMAIAAFATMFALGMFSASEVRAEHAGHVATVVVLDPHLRLLLELSRVHASESLVGRGSVLVTVH